VTYISPLQGSVAYDKIISINISSRRDLVENLEISNYIACGFNHRNIGLDTDCFLIVFPWLKPLAIFEMDIKKAPEERYIYRTKMYDLKTKLQRSDIYFTSTGLFCIS